MPRRAGNPGARTAAALDGVRAAPGRAFGEDAKEPPAPRTVREYAEQELREHIDRSVRSSLLRHEPVQYTDGAQTRYTICYLASDTVTRYRGRLLHLMNEGHVPDHFGCAMFIAQSMTVLHAAYLKMYRSAVVWLAASLGATVPAGHPSMLDNNMKAAEARWRNAPHAVRGGMTCDEVCELVDALRERGAPYAVQLAPLVLFAGGFRPGQLIDLHVDQFQEVRAAGEVREWKHIGAMHKQQRAEAQKTITRRVGTALSATARTRFQAYLLVARHTPAYGGRLLPAGVTLGQIAAATAEAVAEKRSKWGIDSRLTINLHSFRVSAAQAAWGQFGTISAVMEHTGHQTQSEARSYAASNLERIGWIEGREAAEHARREVVRQLQEAELEVGGPTDTLLDATDDGKETSSAAAPAARPRGAAGAGKRTTTTAPSGRAKKGVGNGRGTATANRTRSGGKRAARVSSKPRPKKRTTAARKGRKAPGGKRRNK